MPFFMDKKRAPMWVKIFAGVISLAFILSMVWFVIAPFINLGGSPQQQTEQNMTQEEYTFKTNATMYESMVSKNTSDTTSWVNLGNTYSDWGLYLAIQKKDNRQAAEKWQKAANAYQKALKLNPSNLEVRTDLGSVYYYLGDFQLAMKHFEEVLSREPTMPQALFNMGLAARANEENQKAINYFEKFIEYYPDNPNTENAKKIIEEIKSSPEGK